MSRKSRNSYFPVSETLQDLIMAHLLKNAYYFSIAKTEVQPSYFSDPVLRVIYKGLCDYNKKNGDVPVSVGNILPEIEIHCIKSMPAVDLDHARLKLKELLAFTELEEDSVLKSLAKFIKHHRLDETLSLTLDEFTGKSQAIDLEVLSQELLKSVSADFSKSDTFTLSDKVKLAEMRYKMEQEDGNIIKSCIKSVNASLQYRGYTRGTINVIIGAPGNGKTSFLVNEGAYAAQQFNKILHVFLGDMVDYDGFVRYLSCISGIRQDDITSMPKQKQDELVDKINSDHNKILDRIDVLSYASGQLTIDQLVENIRRLQEKRSTHYDMIIVDYADNLLMTSDFMYEERGTIYTKLHLMGRSNDSVVLVASQPKIEYWEEEIIPLRGAAESSKKQHIADMVMTLGMAQKDGEVGTLYLAKVRRGRTGALIPVKTDWLRVKIWEIEKDEYDRLTCEIPDKDRKRKGYAKGW